MLSQATPIPADPGPPWRRAALAVIFLAPLLLCWRPWQPLFFVHDDWTLLAQMAQMPFGDYLGQSKNEHWFPLFKIIFYGLVQGAGERYHLLVLVNCLLTGVNALLVTRFLRLHLPGRVALGLGLLYAASAAHAPTVWTASYLQFILSLTFFLVALLLAVDYVQRGRGAALAGVGAAAFLSLLCNNFPLLALAALPLYALLLGTEAARPRAANLALVVAAVYAVFGAGYLALAGLDAATFNRPDLAGRLPGPAYPAHAGVAALVSPFCYLFSGYFHFPPWVFAGAGALLGGSLLIVWRWGRVPERRLALFALALNLLPFVLVSLARHHKTVAQAFVPRYATFTLMGALGLLGLAVVALRRRFPAGRAARIIPVAMLAAGLAGQIWGVAQWRGDHLGWGREARALYRQAKKSEGAPLPPEVRSQLIRRPWLDEHTPLTLPQFQAISRFLAGGPEK